MAGIAAVYRKKGHWSSMVYHLPIGHFSVAIRSLAWVEQPHFLQRPVFRNPDWSHRSQLLQISSLSFNTSGSANTNPDLANLLTAEDTDFICSEIFGLLSANSLLFSPAAIQARQFPACGLPLWNPSPHRPSLKNSHEFKVCSIW